MPRLALPVRGLLAAMFLVMVDSAVADETRDHPASSMTTRDQRSRLQIEAPKAIGWAELIVQCRKQEISEDRVRSLKQQCEDAGLSDTDIKKIISKLHLAASTEGHPGLLMEKITEGLVKNVTTDVILSAIRTRQISIASAKRLMTHHYKKTKDVDKVTCSLIYAIESGVSSPLLALILQRGNDTSLGTLTSVISATESLTLAGKSADDIQSFALKCLDKRCKPKTIRKELAAKLKASENR